MGFPALAAVMLGMMVQSTPVSFGAVGTPILIGLNSGMDSAAIGTRLEALGSNWHEYLMLMTREVATACAHGFCDASAHGHDDDPLFRQKPFVERRP